jgi:hypothetical protein
MLKIENSLNQNRPNFHNRQNCKLSHKNLESIHYHVATIQITA